MTTSNPLRSWREQHGLSLADVAGLTGLSDGYLSRLESGERRARPLVKVAIARRLGTSVAVLFPPDPLTQGDGE
jgi:transcriptional regulator with XRE-family HTH domain